jgi:hypothetical protein
MGAPLALWGKRRPLAARSATREMTSSAALLASDRSTVGRGRRWLSVAVATPNRVRCVTAEARLTAMLSPGLGAATSE